MSILLSMNLACLHPGVRVYSSFSTCNSAVHRHHSR